MVAVHSEGANCRHTAVWSVGGLWLLEWMDHDAMWRGSWHLVEIIKLGILHSSDLCIMAELQCRRQTVNFVKLRNMKIS